MDCANPVNYLSCGIQSITNDQAVAFGRDAVEGANQMYNAMFAGWVSAPLHGVIGGAAAEWFGMATGSIQLFLVTLGLMIAGIRMMFLARAEPAVEAASNLLRVSLVTLAGTLLFSVLVEGSTALSAFILETAQINQGDGYFTTEDLATLGSNAAFWLTFGLFALIAILIQWGLMILRAIALTVLVPFWPIAAAGSMFHISGSMFEKTTKWLLAFLIYTPLAAGIFGLSLKLRQFSDGLEGLLLGLGILVMAILALPALMHLLAPVASAVGRASAGTMAVQTIASTAAAGVAVGSAVVAIGATGGAAAPVVAGAAASGGGGSAAASVGTGAAASGATSSTASAANGAAGATGATGATAAPGAPGPAGAAGSTGASEGAAPARSPATGGAETSTASGGRNAGGSRGMDVAGRLSQSLPQRRHTETREMIEDD